MDPPARRRFGRLVVRDSGSGARTHMNPSTIDSLPHTLLLSPYSSPLAVLTLGTQKNVSTYTNNPLLMKWFAVLVVLLVLYYQ